MSNVIKYNTLTFVDVWGELNEFLTDYQTQALPKIITTTSATTLYYLLYARYGNSPIVNQDKEQWKYKVWSLIFRYGGTWEKKVDIQDKIRNLTLDEIKEGAIAIYNKALNPESAPTTHTTEELTYVNEQNVQKHKKNDSQAYAEWMALLEEDVTGYFLDRFKPLFKSFVANEYPIVYTDEE